MAPTMTMMMERTVEKTGLSMKKSLFMVYLGVSGLLLLRTAATGSTFMPCESLW